MSAFYVLLMFVGAQRIAELIVANRNTKRLLAEGAVEVGAGHYPFIVAVHTAWIATLVLWAWLRPADVNFAWLAVYIAIQPLRLWVMLSLGRYWTTRIIVPQNVPLVRKGPYKIIKHPNYVVVVLEIATLPLVIGAWPVAVVLSILNAAVLWVRISAENQSFVSRPQA
jgi:methyltransferase